MTGHRALSLVATAWLALQPLCFCLPAQAQVEAAAPSSASCHQQAAAPEAASGAALEASTHACCCVSNSAPLTSTPATSSAPTGAASIETLDSPSPLLVDAVRPIPFAARRFVAASPPASLPLRL